MSVGSAKKERIKLGRERMPAKRDASSGIDVNARFGWIVDIVNKVDPSSAVIRQANAGKERGQERLIKKCKVPGDRLP